MSGAKAQGGGEALKRFGQAVAEDLLTLAVLHNEELEAARIEQLRAVGFPDGLALKLESERGAEALVLMRNALAYLPAADDRAGLDALAADYADIYLTYKLRVSPCESVWLDEDGLIMQEPMFQIRTWYKKYGLAAPNWRARTDDHLVLQLHFVSHLLEGAEETAQLREAARFLDEHLLRWITPFAERVAGRCATPFYGGLAALTAMYVEELRDLLAAMLDEPRPSAEAIEARMKPRQKEGEFQEIPIVSVPANTPSW